VATGKMNGFCLDEKFVRTILPQMKILLCEKQLRQGMPPTVAQDRPWRILLDGVGKWVAWQKGSAVGRMGPVLG